MILWPRKPLRCHLGLHVGGIETAPVDWEREDLVVKFVRCSRCGDLVPLDLEPRWRMIDRLERHDARL